jgi:hypothetical protein
MGNNCSSHVSRYSGISINLYVGVNQFAPTFWVFVAGILIFLLEIKGMIEKDKERGEK